MGADRNFLGSQFPGSWIADRIIYIVPPLFSLVAAVVFAFSFQVVFVFFFIVNPSWVNFYYVNPYLLIKSFEIEN